MPLAVLVLEAGDALALGAAQAFVQRFDQRKLGPGDEQARERGDLALERAELRPRLLVRERDVAHGAAGHGDDDLAALGAAGIAQCHLWRGVGSELGAHTLAVTRPKKRMPKTM